MECPTDGLNVAPLHVHHIKFNTVLYALMFKPFLAENGTSLAYSCSSAGESYG